MANAPARSCVLCGGAAARPILSAPDTLGISGEVFSVSRCDGCGLVFTDPMPDADVLERHYPSSFWAPLALGPSSGLLARAGTLIRLLLYDLELRTLLGALARGARVLDVGSGSGVVLEVLRRRGFPAVGLERAPEALRISRAAGLDVVDADLLDRPFPEESFDAVVLFHVLEHLERPVETLEEISRVLRPGGLLLVQVPCVESLQLRVFGPRFFSLLLPQHLWHFGPATLARILRRAGFAVLSATTLSLRVSPYAFAASVLGGSPQGGSGTVPSGRSRSLATASLALVAAASLPFVLVEAALGKGATLTVLARRAGADAAVTEEA